MPGKMSEPEYNAWYQRYGAFYKEQIQAAHREQRTADVQKYQRIASGAEIHRMRIVKEHWRGPEGLYDRFGKLLAEATLRGDFESEVPGESAAVGGFQPDGGHIVGATAPGSPGGQAGQSGEPMTF
jgi:hypothetical protein